MQVLQAPAGWAAGLGSPLTSVGLDLLALCGFPATVWAWRREQEKQIWALSVPCTRRAPAFLGVVISETKGPCKGSTERIKVIYVLVTVERRDLAEAFKMDISKVLENHVGESRIWTPSSSFLVMW